MIFYPTKNQNNFSISEKFQKKNERAVSPPARP
jgi:hypothetical protein